MVKFVDGYKQHIEAAEKYNVVYELAKQIFGRRISGKNLIDIVVREGPTRPAVQIFPHLGFIEVNKRAYFKDSLKLAEQGEKITGKEFTLSTTYKP